MSSLNTSIWKESSDHVDELYASMAKAFGELKNAPRTCFSNWAKKDRKTGELLPDYADLATVFDTIRVTYAKHDLSIRQTFHSWKEDGTIMLVTTIGHKSGQFERSYLPMKGNIPPQELAKTATYLKRVAICAAVGIAADDDDDGQQANSSHVVAQVNDEARIEKALTAKVRSAKTAEEISAVMEQTDRGVSSSQLSPEAAQRVRQVAADCASRLPKQDAPASKSKKEPALAS